MAPSEDFSDEYQPLSSDIDETVLEYSEESDDTSDCEHPADSTTSKSGILWTLNKPPPSKMLKENIMNPRPGPTAYCIQRVKNVLDCFFIFFTDEICQEIIKQTNVHGKLHFSDLWNDLDDVELRGFFGTLILMAVYKDREQPLLEMFSIKEGREMYREIFSFNRFRQILRCIHFDNPSTRSERRELDKFCPIRNIWNMWIQTLPICFFPGENVTVDEQLVSFRGRYSFRQYMPMKPAKYGLKFFLAVDPVHKYVVNISPYLGKNGTQASQNCGVGENIVLSLTAPLYNSGRTIVADNFFSSLRLAEKLLDKRLTYLGTIRHNKRDLPPCVLPSRNRSLFSTMFIFFDKYMITSYVNKKRRAVILLSSGTTNTNITNDTHKQKPETIVDYNGSKGGVDTVDRMLASVSVRRFNRRWPMVVFYNMLDLTLINSFCLYKHIFNDSTKLRRDFLKEMAGELYKPLLERNSQMKKGSKRSHPTSMETYNFADSNTSKRRCEHCPRENDKKTSSKCSKCGSFYCRAHSSNKCLNC